MRYKIGVLLVLLMALCFFNYVQAEDKGLPLLSKVIYLDAGHGR